jgi:hypothetical protein
MAGINTGAGQFLAQTIEIPPSLKPPESGSLGPTWHQHHYGLIGFSAGLIIARSKRVGTAG